MQSRRVEPVSSRRVEPVRSRRVEKPPQRKDTRPRAKDWANEGRNLLSSVKNGLSAVANTFAGKYDPKHHAYVGKRRKRMAQKVMEPQEVRSRRVMPQEVRSRAEEVVEPVEAELEDVAMKARQVDVQPV